MTIMIKKYAEQPKNELSIIKNVYGNFCFGIYKIDDDLVSENEDRESVLLSEDQVKILIKDLQKAIKEK